MDRAAMTKSPDTQQRAAVTYRLNKTQMKVTIMAGVVAIMSGVIAATFWAWGTLVEAADSRYLLKAGDLKQQITAVQSNQKQFKIDSLRRDVRYFNDKIWDLEGYLEKNPDSSRDKLRLKELKEEKKLLEKELELLKRQ